MNLRTGIIEYLIIHHTGGNEKDTQAVRDYHINGNGWGDIGYNGVIEKNGTVGQGRDVKWQGAHDTGMINGKSMNNYGYGLSFIGNFSKELMTKVQFEAGVKEAIRICKQYNIPIDKIRKHSDHYNTECPGKLFPWEAFMNAVRDGIATSSVPANSVRKGLIVFNDGDLASALLLHYKTGYPICLNGCAELIKSNYDEIHYLGIAGINDGKNNYHCGVDRVATAKLVI